MTSQKRAIPVHVHAGQNYLSEGDERKYKDIFKHLDKNKDGVIDIEELVDVFSDGSPSRMNVPSNVTLERVKKFLDKADYAQDKQISLLEFLQYCAEREKTLRLTFNNLDKDDDGKISRNDLFQHFQSLGASSVDVNRIVSAMDKDGSLEVNFDEFKDFFLDPDHILYSEMNEFFDSIVAHALDVGTEDVLIREELPKKELQQTGQWWRHLVAGACAGATSRTCTAPLDRLKVFLQVHASRKNGLNILLAWKHMLDEGGIRSLWRGNGINVLKIMPEMALRFYSYEYAKRFLVSQDYHSSEITGSQRFVAGAFAGAFSQTIIYPLEVLKIRLLLRKSNQFSGVSDCCKKMLHNEGVKAFYKGYLPNIIGIMPYAGVDLAVYETLKRQYLRRCEKKEPGVIAVLMCGMVSSTMGQLVSYPLALLRTKLQAQVGGRSKETVIRLNPSLLGARGAQTSGIYRSTVPLLYPDAPQGETMTTLVSQIWRQEGLSGFYRGIVPNMMKVMPAVGISYVAYEKIRHLLGASMS